MKNLSLALSGLSLVAVAILYVLHFSSKSTSSPATDSSAATEFVSKGGLPVAYVNSDSLLANYKLLDELRKSLEEKRNNAQKQLEGRGGKLQEEMASFQKRAQAGMMSNNEMKTGEESLMRKRDELLNYEKTLTAGLIEEERLMNNRLYDSLQSFLKDYNKDGRYQYILNYTKGGAFLLADDKLDITKDVVKGMNDKYDASKK